LLSAKPRVRHAPSYKFTDGDLAAAFASSYGLTPDPWQGDVLDDWLAIDSRGKYVCTTCGLTVGRQNGKNGVIEVRELYGMIAKGEKFLHTAHEVKTARKAFKRLKFFFGEKANDPGARFPELNALVKEVRNTNGQEAIFLHDIVDEDGNFIREGGSVEIVARSSGSGRGFTVDVLVLDEAQDLTNDEIEALLATISSAPLGNPQVIFTGTPPNPDKGQTAEVFTRVRNSVGSNKRLSWTDFGVADGPMPDINDLALARATNPALGGRLQQSVLDLEREILSPEGYARERFGWWGDPETKSDGVMNIGKWARMAKPNAKQPDRGLVVIDVTPSRLESTIGVAGPGKGGKILLIEKTRPGTDWVIPNLLKMLEKRDIVEVALHPGGQAGALIPELVKAGIEYELISTMELGQACAAFQVGVKRGKYIHVGQPELDAAVKNAKTRYASSGETELWDRRDRTISISPLVAVSAAAFRWEKRDDYDVEESYL